MNAAFDRRTFLAAGGGLVVALALPGAGYAADDEAAGAFAGPSPRRLDSWLAIDAQGRVLASVGKIDAGLGIDTAFAQIVADELGVPIDRVRIRMGDTETTVDQRGTGSSNGITDGGSALRLAARRRAPSCSHRRRSGWHCRRTGSRWSTAWCARVPSRRVRSPMPSCCATAASNSRSIRRRRRSSRTRPATATWASRCRAPISPPRRRRRRNGAVVAVVAEVEVERATGAWRVTRFVVAHDCGMVINPRSLEGVIESNLLMWLSRARHEEVRFDARSVTSVDWASYPILDMSEVPDAIDIVMVGNVPGRSYGAGEPSTRPVAAALANALFDSTGRRLRRVPFTPGRLLVATQSPAAA